MTKTLQGKAHGKLIELAADLGLPEGQGIEVSIRTIASHDRTPGEGFRRTEGALAVDSHWDAIMDEIHRSRKLEWRPCSEQA